MNKNIELAKKLKALAERGVGGESVNAQKLLASLLKKNGLSMSDIEQETSKEYFFKASGSDSRLLTQIIKRVNYDLNVYKFPASVVKEHGLSGNMMTECTASEFIEIEQMYSVFKRLYKEELELFYKAFVTANDLLTDSPIKKTTSDLSEVELDEWRRVQEMAMSVKTESIRKQIDQ
jgi:hypothetical protein